MRLVTDKNRLLRGVHNLIPGIVVGVLLATVLPASMVVRAAGGAREQSFTAAADEFGVPKEVLMAVAYNQTRWEDHKGEPSASGGYGLMHLTTQIAGEDGRGDDLTPHQPRTQSSTTYTLDEAASLLGVSPEDLKRDERQNIRGAAALLSKYHKELQDDQTTQSITGWYDAVTKLSGTHNQQSARAFTDDVFATLRNGVSRTTSDGQALAISPQPGIEAPQKLFSLPDGQAHQPDNATECPPTIVCKFVSARFAQNDPANPADYGNYDVAERPKDMKVRYIVIHDTEGSYQSAIDWFRSPESYVAAHYVIRSSDGEVTQMVRNKDVGWHAGNWYMNMHSIGVEHEGFAAQGGAWYTEAMYRSSARLVRYLAEKYDIPLDREHIVGHEQYHGLTPARAKLMHNDPGPFWDWDHYMQLLGAPTSKDSRWGWDGNTVTIAPKFATNKQEVTECKNGTCAMLPAQGTNFVYLRTEPNPQAPLITDAGLHPDGVPGTSEISDWSAKAVHGQRFAVAERRGNWTAVWYGGQKGWFYNPRDDRTATLTHARLITPKPDTTSIPVYGRPIPEASAYKNGVPPLTLTPLQYVIPAGQMYPAYDHRAINDYFYVSTFDRSKPGDGSLIVGKDRYIPIEYNHRQAFVKASDVREIHY